MKAVTWRRAVLLVGSLLLCAGLAYSQDEKKEEEKPKPLPPVVVPGIPPAEETPTPSPTPPTEPRIPDDLRPTTGASPFDYNGSPLGQFNYVSPLMSGSPVDMFNSPRSFTTLDPTRIGEQSAGTTPEMLEMLPGINIQRTNVGGGSLIIRGRNGNQNLIMVDGVPINDAGWRFANVQYLNTIDPGIIERIEVLRGPASVLYGSGAMGGVLNIVTKSRKNFSQDMDLGGNIISNYSTALESPYNRVEFHGNFLNLGFYGGGSYLNVGSLRAGEDSIFDESTTGYSQRAADIRLDWRMTDVWTATFNYQHLMQPSVPRTDRFPTPLIDPTRFVNRPTYFEPQNRDFGYLRFQALDETPGPVNGLTFTLALQQRREGEHEFRPTDRPARERIAFEKDINGYVDLRAFTNLTDRNTLTYGTTFSHDSVYASRRERRGTGAFRYITPTLPPDGTYDQYGVFFLDQQEITDWLIVTGGLRYSNINAEGTAGVGTAQRTRFDRSFQDWSSEVGSVVKLTENLNWVSNIGEGFRAPNLEDLGSDDRSHAVGQDFGSTTLDSEYGITYETGLKYRSELFAGGATWYYSDLESQIVRAPIAGGRNLRINTDGFIQGTELEGAAFLTRNWSLFSTGTYVFGKDTTRNEPLSRMNPATLTLGSRWTYQGPGWNLFLEGWSEMMAKQNRLSAADKNDNRIPLGGTPAWQTFNLRTGLDGGDFGQLTLGLYNVFDQNYRRHGGIDDPGIDFRVGYQLAY